MLSRVKTTCEWRQGPSGTGNQTTAEKLWGFFPEEIAQSRAPAQHPRRLRRKKVYERSGTVAMSRGSKEQGINFIVGKIDSCVSNVPYRTRTRRRGEEKGR